MKKTAALFVMLAMGLSVDAFASKNEVTRCWFEADGQGKDKEEVPCRVRLEDRDKGGPNGTAEPAYKRRELGELDVECTNRFSLEDRYAREFDKHGKEIVVGSRGEKFALLAIEENSRKRDRQNATLIISKDDCHPWEEDTIRLTGRCIEKEED
jgi:hypothetical protein